MYACGIIGHRDFNENINLESFIETLIFEHQVSRFNLGTKSEFTERCAMAIQNLQKKYPFVKMIVYLTRGEFRFIKGEEHLAAITSSKQIFYDKRHEKTFDTGKFSYIKRDQAIIDDSDMILSYFNCNKVINKQKMLTSSGTALAIEYAKKKNKIIFNIAK